MLVSVMCVVYIAVVCVGGVVCISLGPGCAAFGIYVCGLSVTCVFYLSV